MISNFNTPTEIPASRQPYDGKQKGKTGSTAVLLLALVALFVPVAYLEIHAFRAAGTLIYPLDDTFIHMQLAKNLAFNHTWGIYPGAFASASSSLLYTVILAACFKLFGVHTALPLIINCLAGVALLSVIWQWLRAKGASPLVQLLVLLLIIFLTPLPVLIISGMEHTLQCLFSFLFVYSLAEWLGTPEPERKRAGLPWPVIIYGLLSTSIRYEGLFLIGIACLFLLLNRKPLEALKLALISCLPLLVFGIYSVSKGSFILPNSVLVKSENIPLTVSGILHMISNIIIEKWTFARAGIAPLATQRLLFLLPIALIAFSRQVKNVPAFAYVLWAMLLCTLIHLAFAATGWFYRYEAYLIGNSIVILSFLALQFGRQWITGRPPVQLIAAGAVVALLVLPVLLRSGTAFSKARYASTNIYQQQYQMSQFCKSYYNNKTVAANDIGALSFFTNDRVLDLWGLASNEVARSRKKNYWTPGFLDSIVKRDRTTLAIVYDSWFSDSLLKRWNKVATWTIPNNVVCGDSIVSFYAIDTLAKSSLKTNLQRFQPSLPAQIKVAYY